MTKIFTLVLSLLFTLAYAEPKKVEQEAVQLPFDLQKVEGSQLLAKRYQKMGELAMPGAIGKPFGQIIGLLYHIPSSASTMPAEILKTYRANLAKAGFGALVNNSGTPGLIDGLCKQQENFCGRGSLSSKRGNLTPPSLDHDRYSTFRKKAPEGDTHIIIVARQVSSRNNFNWEKGDSKGALVDSKVFEVDDTIMLISVVFPKTTAVKMVREDLSFMRDKLNTQGSVDLYGIYFDTDKAVLKPESNVTLSEIAKLLAAEPSLSLSVVGHTDNVGTPAHNQKLSEARAKAVVKALTQQHKIDTKRLTASGKGATQPLAGNETEEGRAKNRRVELIKR